MYIDVRDWHYCQEREGESLSPVWALRQLLVVARIVAGKDRLAGFIVLD